MKPVVVTHAHADHTGCPRWLQPQGATVVLALAEAERRDAHPILKRAGGNQSVSARQLGISRNRLARLHKA